MAALATDVSFICSPFSWDFDYSPDCLTAEKVHLLVLFVNVPICSVPLA